jgi:hypothetical protein
MNCFGRKGHRAIGSDYYFTLLQERFKLNATRDIRITHCVYCLDLSDICIYAFLFVFDCNIFMFEFMYLPFLVFLSLLC